MKIKKLITVISAVCLLLTAFAVPSAGAIDGKLVTSGAMVEIYSGDRITETQNLGSVAEAWSNAMAKQTITPKQSLPWVLTGKWTSC